MVARSWEHGKEHREKYRRIRKMHGGKNREEQDNGLRVKVKYRADSTSNSYLGFRNELAPR